MEANDASVRGVVVIQEWWDSKDQIQAAADKLRGAGYRTLVVNFREAGGQDTRGAVQHLNQFTTKVAMVGFWYCIPPPEYVEAQQVTIPFQAHFATNDAVFPRSQVEGLQAMVEQTRVRYELHWYKAANAFAELAWQRTLNFLDKHLK